jgi:hypothetical protein
MSHSGVIEFDFSKDYPDWWDWFVRLMADRQALYFKTLLKHCIE